MPKDKPEIRFAGYTDAWEKRKFSEGMAEYTDRVMIQDDKDYPQLSVSNKGKLSLRGITNGKKIGRKRQAKINLKKHPNTLVFTRQTVEQGGIGLAPNAVDGAIVTENMPTIDVDTNVWNIDYLTAFFNTSQYYKNALLSNIEGGSAQVAIHEDKWLESEFSAAEFNEQNQIGTLFLTLNNLIVVNQRKVDLLKELKKGFLQKMFPKNGEDKPEIRFSGFTDAWVQRKLGELMDVSSVKRIHQSDWTSSGVPFYRARDIVAKAKGKEIEEPIYISQDKYDEYSAVSGKVQPGDLLVTGVGTIGIPLLIDGREPLYFKDGNIIWFKNHHAIDGSFFFHQFRSQRVQKFIKDVAGIGTVGTYTIDSGKKTPFNLPVDEAEQQKVGLFFDELDNLIAANQRRVDLLKQEKKALLQKMFV